MVLAIDIGNSHYHLGIFQQRKLIATHHLSTADALWDLVKKQQAIQIVCASARACSVPVLDLPVQHLNAQSPLPMRIAYYTPHTLGADRIAAALGAQTLYPNTNCLIISIGTCITYTLLDKDLGLVGGAITPGLYMRLQSLHAYTHALPLLKLNGYSDCLGKSTHTSMWAGVWAGAQAEIIGMIERYQQTYGSLQVICCGKNAKKLPLLVKNNNLAFHSHLALLGLYQFAVHTQHIVNGLSTPAHSEKETNSSC